MATDISAPVWSIGVDGARVSFVVPSAVEARKICEELTDDKKWEMDIKQKRKKRSKNANDLLWEICTQIAKKISRPHHVVSKDEVYRKHIKEAGVCEYMAMPKKAAERFLEGWSRNGTGWFAEIVDFIPGKEIAGCVKVCAYYGSSTYDTKEMSRILNSVLQDAENLGIDILSESDRVLLEAYPYGQ